MRLNLPYENFEDLQFNNDETLNFAYFNAHIKKLFANFDSYSNVQKLPIATDSNYGLVQIASVGDMQNHTHGSSVLSLNNFQDFLRAEGEVQRKSFTNDNILSLNKNMSIMTGTITVPSGFYIGKTVTSRPSLVLFAHVALEVPGMKNGGTAHHLDGSYDEKDAGRHFTCCEAFESNTYPGIRYIDDGKLRFDRDSSIAELPGTRHVQAYYKDGVVVVRNESFAENRKYGTSSIVARWTLIVKNR